MLSHHKTKNLAKQKIKKEKKKKKLKLLTFCHLFSSRKRK